MKYRGFHMDKRGAEWWAVAEGGLIEYGPYATEDEARAAVDTIAAHANKAAGR